MADAHHKSENRTPTTAAHYYKVGYRPNKGQPNPLPQLTIKGRWLEALGFITGQKIEVIPEAGQLIIRLAGE
ncbi:SymE family type I addiction module toxin [Pantoea sp. S62]|jgi:toxic protein SymE|uniref:SymE family type I addiction module toxin n=1 Tax=Pantoea sp. S62 TaxID=2769342 RepID=UPI00191133F8|nr:SymE family type I addiction module toxin [Pantoea sp. S62]MBK5017490.1 type I toxin-antitoxin system SymE family toxin [Pantoea sp. S62]